MDEPYQRGTSSSKNVSNSGASLSEMPPMPKKLAQYVEDVEAALSAIVVESKKNIEKFILNIKPRLLLPKKFVMNMY